MVSDRDVRLCSALGWKPVYKGDRIVSLTRTDADVDAALALLSPETVTPAGSHEVVPGWIPRPGFIAERIHYAIARAILGDPQSLIVDACAGSGKTTSLMEFIRMLVGNGVQPSDMVFLAHNKAIVTAAQSRLPAHVPAFTTHALALNIYRSWAPPGRPSPPIDEKDGKLWQHARRIAERAVAQASAGSVSVSVTSSEVAKDLVVMLRMAWKVWDWPTTPHFTADWCQRMVAERGLELDDVQFSSRLVDALHLAVLDDHSVIGIDEAMVRVVMGEGRFPSYLYVFVDEAQDLNALQMALLKRLVRPMSGRLVAIGDQNQAINEWRGADGDALNKLCRIFRISPDFRFRINKTLRCPKAIVRAAQRLVPDIVADPRAEEGEEHTAEAGGFEQTMVGLVQAAQRGESAMVICRVAAPIVAIGLELQQAITGARIPGVSVTVRGGQQLQEAMELLSRVMELTKGGNRRAILICEELRSSEVRSAIEVKNHALASLLEDRYTTAQSIIVAAQRAPGQPHPLVYARNLMGDRANPPLPRPGSILCTTIHQAKGLEADRVCLFCPEMIPHPLVKARTHGGEVALAQEKNLHYVGITRAKKALISQSWPGMSRQYPSLPNFSDVLREVCR